MYVIFNVFSGIASNKQSPYLTPDWKQKLEKKLCFKHFFFYTQIYIFY